MCNTHRLKRREFANPQMTTTGTHFYFQLIPEFLRGKINTLQSRFPANCDSTSEHVGPTLLLMMVSSSFPRSIHDRRFMRITDLRLELTPKLPAQLGPASPPPFVFGWLRVVDLLDDLLHSGALPLQLMHPRPHAIHLVVLVVWYCLFVHYM